MRMRLPSLTPGGIFTSIVSILPSRLICSGSVTPRAACSKVIVTGCSMSAPRARPARARPGRPASRAGAGARRPGRGAAHAAAGAEQLLENAGEVAGVSEVAGVKVFDRDVRPGAPARRRAPPAAAAARPGARPGPPERLEGVAVVRAGI